MTTKQSLWVQIQLILASFKFLSEHGEVFQQPMDGSRSPRLQSCSLPTNSSHRLLLWVQIQLILASFKFLTVHGMVFSNLRMVVGSILFLSHHTPGLRCMREIFSIDWRVTLREVIWCWTITVNISQLLFS